MFVSVSIPSQSPWLNLVYKPGDLETDCLITGDSTAVNAIHPQFQAKSLFELLNEGIATAVQGNPALSLELLPTYKILPINYTSTEPVGYPVDVRRAYGYLEFLPHQHVSGPGKWGYYPFGSSDYKIFPKQDAAAICRKFYRLIGQISAIAATFSISDLHAENLIVKSYLPYLIDLELSLTLPIVDIGDTVLYNRTVKAGVNGTRKEDDFRYVEEKSVNGRLVIVDYQDPAYGQNRLMTVDPGGFVEPGDDSNVSWICKSLRDMVYVIRDLNVAPMGALGTWKARVNNVLVRNLPLATGEFRALLTSSANRLNCADVAALGVFIDVKRGDLFERWEGQNNTNPDFLALQNLYVINDFNNGDIPIFYYRIGLASMNIVDSNGNVVLSPGTISYRPDPGSPLQNAPYALPFGRTTFFPTAPFTTNVVNGQLADLSIDTLRGPRIRLLVGQILGQLGKQNNVVSVGRILI